MAHDIIMPALGMAQDTGLLVAWRKAPGDRVSAGEALFEVETDKATMEVEAGFDGYLSTVTAAEGDDVPVGQVIARLVSDAAEVDKTPPKATAGAPGVPQTAPAPAPAPATTPAPVKREPAAAPKLQPAKAQPTKREPTEPQPALPPAQGRILASPKARRMAAEQGLDLSRLARSGHPQPYHVADLDHLRGLAATGRSTLSARIDGAALLGLLRKATDADTALVLAAFARGAWRQSFGEELGVTWQRHDGLREDKGGTLLLVDLTGTRLTSYAPPEGLVLAVAMEGGAVTLTLSFDEAELPFGSAVAWLNETAARIEDPVRQLV